jgi:hypothetical protein
MGGKDRIYPPMQGCSLIVNKNQNLDAFLRKGCFLQ